MAFRACTGTEWKYLHPTITLAEPSAYHFIIARPAVRWGGDWRMPTEAEFDELRTNTTRTWKSANNSITIGGQTVSMPNAGCYFVSKVEGHTDKYIFLPATGRRDGKELYDDRTNGNYWSSSLDIGTQWYGRYLKIKSSDCYIHGYYRNNDFPVRPVR